ncbi:hypothetical protein C8J25_109113 [Sphingomonas faeni]|uniref:Uncharacterized protein n=1 Tax=Sphingomonas faeni TaxID=185950 RepID=A0A2T5TZK4_9SPHN|nr:hypothetical protein [Sphingomonas faeni]PTW44683.1 hypothetical protein C8J25_109113 [Sphingomonas faeni]
MSTILGTNVAAPITPFDTADQYPTHREEFGQGGYRATATAADRDAIPAARREAGMRVKVLAADTAGITGRTYTLAADLLTWAGELTEGEMKQLTANSEKRARRISDGRVYALTNNLDGTIKISASQGRIWDENQAGSPSFRVNGIADVVLSANRALVVDLDSAVDSNGRLTPTVVNLGSVGSVGWQSGNWVVLFSHTTSSSGLPIDQIYGGGAYRLNLPVPDTTPLDLNTRRARYNVTGRIYALSAAPNALTISASQGRVYAENNAGNPLYKIDGVTNVVIPNGQALMVDLDSAVNASGRVVPYVGNPASVANAGWQSGNKLVLFANANTDAGLPIDQIYGGGPYVLHLPVPDTSALATSTLRTRRTVDGRIFKLVNNGNGTVTVSISQGRVWKENATGSIEYRIDGLADVVLGANQAIVANLDDQPAGSLTRVVPTVVNNLAAGANSGWQSGNKIVLFSHTTSGSSASPLDQIYGGGAYRLEVASIARDNSLVIAKVAPTNGGIGSMNIYVPGAKARWTAWRFLRSLNTDLTKGPKVDVWRNSGQYDVSLDASYLQTIVAQLTRQSEIETAVMQPGRADYSGGISHGNQVMTEFKAFADGSEFDPAVAQTITAKELTFYMTSALFDNAAPDTKIADVYTHWRWTVKGLRLEVTFVISGAQTFSYIYAGIFPVFRQNDAGQLMVTKGRRSPPRPGQYEEDLTTATYSQFTNKASELVGYGNGYIFRARKVAGYDDATAPLRSTYFAPTVDNKFYFNQITAANPQTFADGTVIGPVVTEFEILNPN